MIFELVKRDRTFQFALYFTSAAALIAALLPTAGHNVATSMSLIALLFLSLLPVHRCYERTTLFHAALPIAGRQMFLARAIACGAFALGPFFGFALVCFLTRASNWVTPLTYLAGGSYCVFLMLCALSLRLEEFAGPSKVAVGILGLGLAGIIALSIVPFFPKAIMPLLALCTFGALVRWITAWNQVPECFQAAPFEPAAAPKEERHTASGDSPSAWWALLRSIFNWNVLMLVPLVFWMAALDGQYLAVLLGCGIPDQRLRTRWLVTLPVSPRKLLLLLMVPYLLPLGAGFATSPLLRPARDQWLRFEAVPGVPATHPTVHVPLQYWEHAENGVAPVIQAPWGETYQPPVSSIAGYAIYNPYASGPANTNRFQFWQFSRATVAVYGRWLTFEQVMNRDSGVRYAPRVMQWRVVLLGTAALMAVGIFTRLLLGVQDWRYLAASRWRKPIWWSMFGLSLVAPSALEVWSVRLEHGSLLLALLYRFVLNTLRVLPDNPAVIATAGAAIVVLPYFLLEHQFCESEPPSSTIR